MKNTLILLFQVVCTAAYAQIINFPDANFKNALVNTKCVDTDGANLSANIDADLNDDGEIDISEALKVISLEVYSNNISSLCGIENFTNLEILGCWNNQLTSLNLTCLSNLFYLRCDFNQLITLNIKGTSINQFLHFENNPNLNYICCNEGIINVVKNKAVLNGQNCEVNSYCSFTPGGKFYVLKGKNIYDDNNNGCDDLDRKLPNMTYNITNGIIAGTFISNTLGNYQIPLQEGNYNITPILVNPQAFTVTPSSFQVTFPNTSDTIIQNFCINPKGISRQTNITVLPLTPPARPGFDVSYKIVWQNVGNQIENGTLNFKYEEPLLDFISATQSPDQIADGIVKWNFANLLPFEKREITVTLKVNRPTDTPSVNAGDKLYLTASILDNIFTLENTVVGSYDPNDKTCLQGDRVKPDMVGEYVDYLVRFENTGNFAAENVVVKDIIDSKRFDVSSLQITDASHEVYTRIQGNKVEFIFENIQLPFDDASNDGYIAFKIKTLPTLVLGDSLKNLADIYFDYDFPIRTNEAQTTINNPVVSTNDAKQQDIIVYPNPASTALMIENKNNHPGLYKLSLHDINGQVALLKTTQIDRAYHIDVSGLPNGIYFLKLKTSVGLSIHKIVVQK